MGIYVYIHVHIYRNWYQRAICSNSYCLQISNWGKKLDERQTYKTDFKILHAVVPWFYMKYAEVLYLIFWYNKSHVISVMASSFLTLISCIHGWFCITGKQDQFTKKAPSSALSQTRILMMVRIPRYTRICTLALLLQMYMSSISICILPSVVNASTLVLSMFFNVYFFFFGKLQLEDTQKKTSLYKIWKMQLPNQITLIFHLLLYLLTCRFGFTNSWRRGWTEH